MLDKVDQKTADNKDSVVSEGYEDAGFIRDAETLSVLQDTASLKRWGFQHAIKDKLMVSLSADNLLKLYNDKIKEKLVKWDDLYNSINKRFDDKILELKAEMDKANQDIENDPTLADLEKRKTELLDEMKNTRTRMLEVRKKMLDGKRNMLGALVNEGEDLVDKAVALQKKVYKEFKELYQTSFNDSSLAFKKHIESCNERKMQLQEKLTETNKEIKEIGADGVNPFSADLLIGIGTTVAAAAGYFFSVYTTAASFGNQDALYFLLGGIFKAGSAGDVSLLTRILLLTGCIIVIGYISYLCFYLFNKFFKASKPDQDGSRFTAGTRIAGNNSRASAKVKAGSLFSLWLQIAPIVLIAGIIVLLLAVNSSISTELGKVNSSVEGILTGTAIALGIGAAMFVYIMKVIEPRLRRHKNGTGGFGSHVLRNWELVLSIALLLCCSILIICFPLIDGKLDSQYVKSVSILEFIAVALLSAFPFAYGVRFRGLIAVTRFLQREIDYLDNEIAYHSSPVIPEISVDYTNSKNGITESVLGALQNRISILNEVSSGEKENGRINNWNLRDFFKSVRHKIWSLIKGQEKTPVLKIAELSGWEKRYFPEIDEEMKILVLEYREYETEFKVVTDQLDKLSADANLEKDKMDAEQKAKLRHIELLRTYKEKAEKKKLEEESKFEKLSLEAEAAILEGYHLGIWYRENQLGPGGLYYSGSGILGQNTVEEIRESGNGVNKTD